MTGNMGIIIAVAKLSSSHPALLAWTSGLLHTTAMHDNRLVVVTQKYTTRLESKRGPSSLLREDGGNSWDYAGLAISFSSSAFMTLPLRFTGISGTKMICDGRL